MVVRPRAVATGLLLVLAARCGQEVPSATTEPTSPLIVGAPSDFGMAALTTGRLALDVGCLRLADDLVVWPDGSTWDDEGQAVTTPSGVRMAVGREVSLGGGQAALSSGGPFPPDVPAAAQRALTRCAGRTGLDTYWLASPSSQRDAVVQCRRNISTIPQGVGPRG